MDDTDQLVLERRDLDFRVPRKDIALMDDRGTQYQYHASMQYDAFDRYLSPSQYIPWIFLVKRDTTPGRILWVKNILTSPGQYVLSVH